MSAKTVVIARTPDGNEELAEAIRAQGYTVLIEPVLTVERTIEKAERTIGKLPEVGQHLPLVFTSANAIKAFAEVYDVRENPVYTVGRNTADEARQAGFTAIKTAAGTVDDLVDILSKDCAEPQCEILYVRGEEVSKELKFLMAKEGIAVRELTAYRSVPAENLSVDLLRALDGRNVAACMFFSPRGGRVFCELIEQYGRAPRTRTTKALCISGAVLQSVSVLPFGGTAVADTPDRYGMIKLLEHLKD